MPTLTEPMRAKVMFMGSLGIIIKGERSKPLWNDVGYSANKIVKSFFQGPKKLGIHKSMDNTFDIKK